jgi:hypothetical protein
MILLLLVELIRGLCAGRAMLKFMLRDGLVDEEGGGGGVARLAVSCEARVAVSCEARLRKFEMLNCELQ